MVNEKIDGDRFFLISSSKDVFRSALKGCSCVGWYFVAICSMVLPNGSSLIQSVYRYISKSQKVIDICERSWVLHQPQDLGVRIFNS